jgi:hypothetical protein
MFKAAVIESSDPHKAGYQESLPIGVRLAVRGRRAYYVVLNRVIKTWHDWWHVISAVAVVVAMVVTFLFLAPVSQLRIGVIDANRLAAVQTLLVTMGGSFVGATAIVSAMLMYALQVNVERMPHELFRRFSTDRQILSAFAGTFVLAGVVASISMVLTPQNVVMSLLTAFWASSFILILFGFAYRRTLDLVSPNFQLLFLVKVVEKDFARWGKAAERIARSARLDSKPDEASMASSLDVVRLQLFQYFPNWIQQANETLFYAMSFASRYAQKGDYGVVTSAYIAVLKIHALYLRAKGRTFVAANGFLDSPLVNDALLNGTLESLRQIHRDAIAQGNERFIEANLQVMAELAELYLSVDYASPYVTGKTHANLAAHYLADSIKEVIPHKRPDVLMKGVRLLGHHARLCVANGGKDNIPQLSEKISEIALIGVIQQDQMPVTVTAMGELAKLTMVLLQSPSKQDLHFPLHRVRRDIHQVAMLVVERTKDEPLGNRHGNSLSGVYSATDPAAFSGALTALAEQLLNAEVSNQAAQQIIRNIQAWSDQLYLTQKELLLAAITGKSGFVFDMIYWITNVTKVLAMLANATACPPHSREDLQKASQRLVGAVSWIPHDKEVSSQLARFNIHERLFECAMSLYNGVCIDVAVTVSELLVSWAFRFGCYENGWGTLEQSLYGVAVLSLRAELQPATSVAKLTACMAKHTIPQELLDRTARDIRTQAQPPFYDRHIPGVEYAMSLEDPKELSEALMAIANVLSPSTAAEPIRSRHHF